MKQEAWGHKQREEDVVVEGAAVAEVCERVEGMIKELEEVVAARAGGEARAEEEAAAASAEEEKAVASAEEEAAAARAEEEEAAARTEEEEAAKVEEEEAAKVEKEEARAGGGRGGKCRKRRQEQEEEAARAEGEEEEKQQPWVVGRKSLEAEEKSVRLMNDGVFGIWRMILKANSVWT